MTLFLPILALLATYFLNFRILEPLLSPQRSYATGFGCHTTQGCTRHAQVASDAFECIYRMYPSRSGAGVKERVGLSRIFETLSKFIDR